MKWRIVSAVCSPINYTMPFKTIKTIYELSGLLCSVHCCIQYAI